MIKLPNGEYPSVAGVTVRGLVLSPNNCILREEEFSSVNIVNGYINLVIGSGTTDGDDPGFTMAQLMDNSKVRNSIMCINSAGVRVNGTYDPSSGNGSGVRKFRIDLAVGGMPVLADFNMRAMAYAVNSETLNGKAENDFLQVDAVKGVTQTNLEKVLLHTTKLENLLTSSNVNADGTVSAASAVTAVTAQGLEGSYVVPVNQGGTNATTAAAALQNLLPAQTGKANHYLQTDGTNVSWQPVVASGGTNTEVAANAVYAGPTTGGNAAPSFRSLVEDDIPSLDTGKITSGVLSTARLGTGTADNTKYLSGGGTWETLPTADATKLPLAGGTMSGNIDMGTQNITNANSISVGRVATNTVTFTSTTPASPTVGSLWFEGGVLKYENASGTQVLGVAGSGIQSVNGATGKNQTLSPTASATTYGFSTAGDTHTFSIPSAGTAGVLAGTISKTEYDAFAAKLDSTTTLSGDVSGALGAASVNQIKGIPVQPTTYASGQVLRYDDGQWINALLNISSDVTGTLAITNGGTGATTAAGALNNLLPSQAGNANKLLQTNGATVSWVDPPTTGITALTGEVTASGSGSVAATITDGAVTSIKILDGTINSADMNFTGVNSATSSFVMKNSTGAFNDFACSTTGHVPTWTATGFACQPKASGTVTNVSSANGDIAITNSTTTPTLTLNSGTAGGAGDANKVPKLDANGLLPAAMLPSLTVAKGGTGLTSGTSGGIPYFNAASTMASSGALTSNGVVLGGGAGSAPKTTTAGTAYQVLRVPAGGGAPAFGEIDLSNPAAVTGVLPLTKGGTGATTQAAAQTALGIGSAGTKSTGTVSGSVPLIGYSGIIPSKMCTSDVTSSIICNTDIPNSQWTTSGNNIYYNQSGGKVGIGTTTPQEKLSIDGNISFAGETAVISVVKPTGPFPFPPDLRIQAADGPVGGIPGNLILSAGKLDEPMESFRGRILIDGDIESASWGQSLSIAVREGVGTGGNLRLTGGTGNGGNSITGTGGQAILQGGTGADGNYPTGTGGDAVIMGGLWASGNYPNPGSGGNVILQGGKGSSSATNGHIVMRIDAEEVVRVSNTGNVGIGKNNPVYKLDVIGDIAASGCLRSSAGIAYGTCVSDERLKTDIEPFDLGLEALLGINPHFLRYNGLGGHPVSDKPELGVIAQEVEKTAPQLIATKKVKLNPEDSHMTEIKQVNYTAFTYVLINSVKELFYRWFEDSQAIRRELASKGQEITKLKAEVTKQKQESAAKTKELEDVKARLDKIEKMLNSK